MLRVGDKERRCILTRSTDFDRSQAQSYGKKTVTLNMLAAILQGMVMALCSLALYVLLKFLYPCIIL